MKKQFAYADKKSIPYAVVIGTDELASGKYGLKNLRTGEQEALSLEMIIKQVKG
jgi:histidyl-tRNA synthetase